MSEELVKTESITEPAVVQSPPPAAAPLKQEADEPRTRLHQLAELLLRNGINRSLMLEYMQLRRALR